uniref:IF rod domain-containing protein n=1 Tax=Oryzias latipes TaxID=8090 RepID=A0A3P9M326_ORYLA
MTPEEERFGVEGKNWNFDSEPAFLRLWSQPGCWWADLRADTCYKSLPSIHPACVNALDSCRHEALSSAVMQNGAEPSQFSLENLRNLIEGSAQRGFDVPDSGGRPFDDNAGKRQTLNGLNHRLEDYLRKVIHLKDKNQIVQTQIDAIEAERRESRGLDWNQTQETLEDQERQIKEISEEKVKLILNIKTTKLEKEDFKRKLEAETTARRTVEKELEELVTVPLLRQQQDNLRREIEILNKTLQQQKTEHQAKVKDLCEKIRESKVTVEIKSQNSNLTNIVKEIRQKYDAIAKRNMEEMDEWYQKELKSIQEQENHHRSELESGNSEYTHLLKEKKMLEIHTDTLITKIKYLEETLKESRQQVAGNRGELKKKLEELISQIDEQQKKNQDLLELTGSLQVQIRKYKDLVGYKHQSA